MRKKLEGLSVENFEPRINYVESKTEKELEMIKYGEFKKEKIKKDIKKNKTFYFVIFAIICALFGVLNFVFSDIDVVIYYFGLVFFLGGVSLVFYFPHKSCLFFLFSHGGIGLCLMLIPIISKYKLSIYLSDSPTKLIIYLVLILVFTILAFFCSTIYILNDKLKSNLKYCKFILISFLIVIAMVTFLPKLLPYLI